MKVGRLKLTIKTSSATIILGLGVWIICNNTLEIISNVNSVRFESWLPILLSVIGIYGRAIAIAVLIIAGIAAIRKNGSSLIRILMPILGVGTIIYLMIQNLICYDAFNDISITSKRMSISKEKFTRALEDKSALNKNSTNPEVSRFYAKVNFTERGVLTEYYAPDGQSKIYTPTQADIDQLRKSIRMEVMEEIVQERVRERANDYLESIFRWMLFAFVSVLVGLFVPIQKDALENPLIIDKNLQSNA